LEFWRPLPRTFRAFQKFDDLHEFFFGLTGAGDVGEGEAVLVILAILARAALPERHGAHVLSLHRTHHEEDEDADREDREDDREHDAHPRGKTNFAFPP